MLVTCYLECQVYAEHTKRNTTRESFLADCLTRDTTAKDACVNVTYSYVDYVPRYYK